MRTLDSLKRLVVLSLVVNTSVAQTTQLEMATCGSSGVAFNQNLNADSVSGAGEYHFRVVGPGVNEVFVSTDRDFRLEELTTPIAYNTTYSVEVATMVNGGLGPFGPSCDITTESMPTTQLGSQFCGVYGVSLSEPISADIVTNADQYEFEITNITDQTTSTVIGTSNSFTIGGISPAGEADEQFWVRVRVNIDGVWSEFGSACLLSSAPESEPSFCGHGHDGLTTARLHYDNSLENPPLPPDPPLTVACPGTRFVLHFDDIGSGFGFDDPVEGAARRNCACAVAQYVESALDIPVGDGSPIDILFEVSLNTGNGFLAAASSFYDANFWNATSPGFHEPLLMQHVMTGVDPDPAQMDGSIFFDFGFDFYTCTGTPGNCQFDFYSVLLHEFTHLLGFASLLTEDVSGNPVSSHSTPGVFSRYDEQFLFHGPVNGPYTKVVDVSGNIQTGTSSLSDDGLWMYGVAADNQPIASFSGFAAGTSVSHFANNWLNGWNLNGRYPRRTELSPGYDPEYVMAPTIGTGDVVRTYSMPDLRALTQLGFNIRTGYPDFPILGNHPVVKDNTNFPNFSQDGRIGAVDGNTNFANIDNCGSLVIDLNSPGSLGLTDPDGDAIRLYPGSLFNLQGCGDGNNHDQLTVSPDSSTITFTPRGDFIGMVQFAFNVWDGQEKGAFCVYSVHVDKNDACWTGGQELIVNGDFEQGPEIPTLSYPNANTDYYYPFDNGYCHVADAVEFVSIGWDDLYVRGSQIPCVYNGAPFNSTGSGDPTISCCGPNNNRFFRAILGGAPGIEDVTLTLSDEIQCGRYILSFDYASANWSSNPQTFLQFRFTNTLYSSPGGQFVNPVNVTIPGQDTNWNNLTIPIVYNSTSPSNFLQISGIVPNGWQRFYFDNFSLIPDTSYSPLSIVPTLPSSICEGQQLTYTSGDTGGEGPISYSWDFGNGDVSSDQNPDYAFPDPGTYVITLEVTDAVGCGQIFTDTVTVDPGPTFTVSSTNDCGACDGTGEVITSGGTAPITFSWSPGGYTSSQMTGLCGGMYDVEISDAMGCVVTAVVNVPTGPGFTLSAVDATCAATNDGSIDLTVTGGTGPYVFDWSHIAGASDPEDVSSLAPGTYTVTVTDATGCTGSQSINVGIIGSISIQSNVREPDCFYASTGSIDITPIGGAGPYVYDWDNDGFDDPEDLSGVPTGTYTVSVQDANGCEATETFTIISSNPLTVTGVVTSPSCGNVCDGSVDATVIGGVPQYNYSWIDQASNPVGSTEDVTGLCPGDYSLLVVDDVGCKVLLEVSVPVGPRLNVDETIAHESCLGSSDGSISINVLTGIAPFTYDWIGPTGPIVTNPLAPNEQTGLAAGAYEVTITDATGCLHTHYFSILPGSNLMISTIGNPESCNGNEDGTATVYVNGGTAPIDIDWNAPGYPGTGDPSTISGLPAGTYDVMVTDANGCSQTTQVVVDPGPTFLTGVSVTHESCINGQDGEVSASLFGGNPPFNYHYQWILDGAMQYPPNQPLTGLMAGQEVTLIATDLAGCEGTFTTTISLAQNSNCCDPGLAQNPDLIVGPAGKKVSELVASGVNQFGPGDYILLNGDLTVDQDFTITGAIVRSAADVKIHIDHPSDPELTVLNSTLKACGIMWEGIIIESGQLYARNSTFLEAKNAVVSRWAEPFDIESCTFRDNYVGISVETTHTYSHSSRVVDTDFQGSTSLLPPYGGARAFAGIKAYKSWSALEIGDAAHGANTFTNSWYGIKAGQSVIYAENNEFTDIIGSSHPLYPFHMGSAIYADSCQAVVLGGLNPGQENTFTNCNIACYSRDFEAVQAQNNTIQNTVTNINGEPVGSFGFYLIHAMDGYFPDNGAIITDNHIENCEVGISRMWDNPQGTRDGDSWFNDNYFTGTLFPNSYGIDMQVVGAMSSSPNSLHYIERNTFVGQRKAIHTRNLNEVAWVRVIENDISLNNLSGSYGLGFDNGREHIVVENDITALNGASVSYGINLKQTTNSYYRCNTISGMNDGLAFFGGCQNTMVYRNNLSSLTNGLALSFDAILGPQGSSSFASDNLYNGVSNSTSTYYGTDGANSALYARNTPPFLPAINIADGSSSAVPVVSATGWDNYANFCTYQNGWPRFFFRKSWQDVANGVTDYSAFPEGSRFNSEMELYELLKSDTLLRDTLAEMNAYFKDKQYSTIAKLSNVDDLIAQGHLELALSALQELNVKTVPERTAFDIRNLTISHLLHGLSESELERMKAIAHSCPFSKGKDVFRARAFMDMLNGRPIDYPDYCMEEVQLGTMSVAGELYLPTDATLYPNPNRGSMTLEYFSYEQDVVEFYLYDRAGKQVDKRKLEGAAGKVEMTFDVETGTYIGRLQVNGVQTLVEPIVIMR